jgi:hypothetical protein
VSGIIFLKSLIWRKYHYYGKNILMQAKFDVVIVPDFSGNASKLFEIRTLFFLASWLEYGGLTKTFPLHIAGIGPVPKSVYTLGERCQARLTQHQPLHEGGFLNKLRGLEVEGLTKNALLLDVDILLLADISGLTNLLLHNCISADVANDAHLSKYQWTHVYSALNLPCPPAQMTTLNRAINVNMRNNPNYDESTATFPYYNSGVLLFPWSCNLKTTWEQHFFAINQILREPAFSLNERVFFMDQPALATAIIHLQSQGIQFLKLPKVYHARWQHIYARMLSINKAKLFHAIGLFRYDSHNIMQAINIYHNVLRDRCTKAIEKQRSQVNYFSQIPLAIKYKLALRDISIFRAKLELLYTKYIQDLLPLISLS